MSPLEALLDPQALQLLQFQHLRPSGRAEKVKATRNYTFSTFFQVPAGCPALIFFGPFFDLLACTLP